MEILIMGLATFFNFMILKWKFEHRRYADLALDVATLAIISYLFSGSMTGMAIGMIASAFMSFYLLIFPPKFTTKI